MGAIMRWPTGLLLVLVVGAPAAAQEPVKPIPAWCGGSYSPTGGLEPKAYVEAVKAGQALGAGTNFGSCVEVVREVRGSDGTVRQVSIPTYPAAPSSQVTFAADGRILHQNGEVDQDGKAIVLELTLPAVPK